MMIPKFNIGDVVFPLIANDEYRMGMVLSVRDSGNGYVDYLLRFPSMETIYLNELELTDKLEEVKYAGF